MSQSIEEQMKLLHEKIDRILVLLEEKSAVSNQRTASPKTQKQKSLPLSAEEISRFQDRFEKLYMTWDAGEEVQVEKELDTMDLDEIRRFADANNLNVTSKTPKQKIMQLIAGRFRERRQLVRSHFNRKSSTI